MCGVIGHEFDAGLSIGTGDDLFVIEKSLENGKSPSVGLAMFRVSNAETVRPENEQGLADEGVAVDRVAMVGASAVGPKAGIHAAG